MATATLVSVEEYLRSSYEPDRDFIEGELQERNTGEHLHGLLQLNIGSWLKVRAALYGIRPLTEVRVRINERRFRIPDVVVLPANAPRDPVIVSAPLLCVEIVSQSDSMSAMWDRIGDYFSMGVPVCWIVDPSMGTGWNATSDGWTKAADGILRVGQIEMPLSEVLE